MDHFPPPLATHFICLEASLSCFTNNDCYPACKHSPSKRRHRYQPSTSSPAGTLPAPSISHSHSIMSVPTLRHRPSRPAYLDGLFSPKQSNPDYRPRTPSLTRSAYSSTESINATTPSFDYTNTNWQQSLNHTRPLTPACEEEAEVEANSSGDDSKSVLSLSISRSLKPRLRLRNFSLKRRSEPSLSRSNSSRPTSGDSSKSPPFSNFLPGKRHSNPTSKPLPPLPAQAVPPPVQTQELNCNRCYYFAARNCKGWTMGGSSNDACEACLVCCIHNNTYESKR